MSNKKKKKNSNYVTKNPKPVAKKKKKISKDTLITLICVGVVLLAMTFSITYCAATRSTRVGDGACVYAETRNVEGHDMRYVKMNVKGHGAIVLALDATTAPITVENFMNLVNKGFYDGLTFHRILEGFMIQGGDPEADGTGGNTDANGKEINIKGEFSENGVANDISHLRGVISMARNGYSMDSASSQFFICNEDSVESLDGKYAAFGYVLAGLSVVDSITEEGMKYTSVEENGAIDNKANQPIIKSVVEISEKEAMRYAK